MNFFIFIGLFASIFGLTSSLPQIYKIIKTKSSTDLSYGTIIISLTNQIFWLIYAVYLQNTIYIINGSGHLIIEGTVLLLKAHYDKINSQNDPS
tara:strand:+ start:2878 stop:3159 length:282 start_codon:yes stop_codon:yes gene_type:complete